MTKQEIVRLAAKSAVQMYRQGAITAADTNLWALAESRVRARMIRKNKSWTEDQIHNRVKWRLRLRAIPSLLAPLPFPLSLAATTVDGIVDAISTRAYKEIRDEGIE